MKSLKTVIDGAEITKNVAAQIKDIQNGGHNEVLENLEEGINAILALYNQLEYVKLFNGKGGVNDILVPPITEVPISEKAILQSIIGLRSIINIIVNLLPDDDE